ncbi:MAG: hypothetical protein CVV64_07235 [Candidatus Wallbacteria bacterium HGW-Wallbacteria-1]|jgi:hypothetical protein|uniref:Uncharacterized protein n=1 Tax=Candidatus Wallbacteria bacterium HGW-Wallbacteria-1 TaxID=2013854 RepID=A0A2N1PT87_9BACT|nr:MAG: hypothetical protein CVV64_07235 [Candidatus Wallbacteria bacterium HGW-Wallbacteria-1]
MFSGHQILMQKAQNSNQRITLFLLLTIIFICYAQSAFATVRSWIDADIIDSLPFNINKAEVVIKERSHDTIALSKKFLANFREFLPGFEARFRVFRHVQKQDLEKYRKKIISLYFTHYRIEAEKFSGHIDYLLGKGRLRELIFLKDLNRCLKDNPQACEAIENTRGFPFELLLEDDRKQYEDAAEYALFKDFSGIFETISKKNGQEYRHRIIEFIDSIPPKLRENAKKINSIRIKIKTISEIVKKILFRPDGDNSGLKYDHTTLNSVTETLSMMEKMDDSRLATWVENFRQTNRSAGRYRGIENFLSRLAPIIETGNALAVKLKSETEKLRAMKAPTEPMQRTLHESAVSELADDLYAAAASREFEKIQSHLKVARDAISRCHTIMDEASIKFKSLTEARIEVLKGALNSLEKFVHDRDNIRETYEKVVFDYEKTARQTRDLLASPATNSSIDEAFSRCRAITESGQAEIEKFSNNTASIKNLFMTASSVNYMADLDGYSLYFQKNPVFGSGKWSLGDILSIDNRIEVSDIFSPIRYMLPIKNMMEDFDELKEQYGQLQGLNKKIEIRTQQKQDARDKLEIRHAAVIKLINEADLMMEGFLMLPIEERDIQERDRLYNAFAKAETAFKRAGHPTRENSDAYVLLRDKWEKIRTDWSNTLSPPSFHKVYFAGLQVKGIERSTVNIYREDLVDQFLVVDLEMKSVKYPASYVKISLDGGRTYNDAELLKRQKELTWWRYRIKPRDGDEYDLRIIAADCLGVERILSNRGYKFKYFEMDIRSCIKSRIYDLEEIIEDCDYYRFMEKFNRREFITYFERFRDEVRNLCNRARNMNFQIENISYGIRKDTIETKLRWVLDYDDIKSGSSVLTSHVKRKGVTMLIWKRCPNYTIIHLRDIQGKHPFQP